MADLSPRQKEIVELVGRDGLPWAEVADKLGISVHTIREHVVRITRKLDTTRKPREAITVLYWQGVTRNRDMAARDT